MSGTEPSPLAVAVCDGDQERVEQLLDAGEPMDKRDHKGRTPLMLALLSVEMEIAQLLVERGANPNLQDAKGRYPLHISLLRPDRGLTEMMLDRSARPDLPDRESVTPLHLAAATGRALLVTRLMKQLAPLDAQDKHGATPLHMAALNNRPAATRALLRGGPDLELKTGDGRTALYVAVEKGAHQVIELLVAARADPMAHARFGKTPLALAYGNKDYDAVELMEGPGTRVRIEDGLAAATEHLIPKAYSEELENRLEALRESIGPITNDPHFDVNRFLEVFDRVRIKEGYVLDYYHDHLDEPLEASESCHPELVQVEKSRRSLREFLNLDDMGDLPRRKIRDPNAQPYVFSRPADANRVEAVQLARDTYWRRRHLMKHLEFERSPEGLLQWVIFRTAVSQFHLCWHANYYDLQFILSPTGLERVLASLPLTRTKIQPLHRYSLEQLTRGTSLADPERAKLRALDLTPWVKVAGDLGEVRIFTFTKWGGFSWRHCHLRWPHHVDRFETETVVEYNCRIQF